jgi:hypothetical protein
MKDCFGSPGLAIVMFEKLKKKIGEKAFQMFMPEMANHIMKCLMGLLLQYHHLLRTKAIDPSKTRVKRV